MMGVLDDFLAIFSPFVTIVQHIYIAHSLETEPRFPQLSSNFHLLHLHIATRLRSPPIIYSNPRKSPK